MIGSIDHKASLEKLLTLIKDKEGAYLTDITINSGVTKTDFRIKFSVFPSTPQIDLDDVVAFVEELDSVQRTLIKNYNNEEG